MKKTPEIKEKDLLLEVKLDPQHFWETKSIKFGKRVVVIHGNHNDAKLTIQKNKSYKGDMLKFQFIEYVPQYETCNRGHRHETAKKIFEMIHLNLPWEQVEQLVSWINDGDPSQILRASRPDLYDIEKLREENSKLKKLVKQSGLLDEK